MLMQQFSLSLTTWFNLNANLEIPLSVTKWVHVNSARICIKINSLDLLKLISFASSLFFSRETIASHIHGLNANATV